MDMTPPGDNRDLYQYQIDGMKKSAEAIKKDMEALQAGMQGAAKIRQQATMKRGAEDMKGKLMNDAVSEDYNKDEYDEEGEMAKNQLEVACDATKQLKAMIK